MESYPPPHTSSGSSPAACQQCWHHSLPRLSSESSTPRAEKENISGKNVRCRRAPIEFTAARSKTLAVEGIGRWRRETLPTGREAFPDREARCPSLHETKEV